MKSRTETALGKAAITLAVVGAFLALAGCENVFGSEEDELSGTAPVIDQVNLYRYNSGSDTFTATFTFAVGERAYIELLVTDPDLDLAEITATTTHTATGNSDTQSLPVEPQEQASTAYVVYTDIIGPAGTWSADFLITDQEGNTSDTYTRTVTVVE